MKKKIVKTKKNTWKMKTKFDVEDWLSVMLIVIVVSMILIKIILGA